MYDVAASLRPAIARADDLLGAAEKAVADSAVARDGQSADAAMADAARAAIFDEALMNALNARLRELKSVTR